MKRKLKRKKKVKILKKKNKKRSYKKIKKEGKSKIMMMMKTIIRVVNVKLGLKNLQIKKPEVVEGFVEQISVEAERNQNNNKRLKTEHPNHAKKVTKN